MATEKGCIHSAPTSAVDVLRGALPSRNKPEDLFRPHVLSYPSETRRTTCCLDSYRLCPRIEHLDICTTWKGLSFKQASELLFWERALVSNVESMIQRANGRKRIRVDLQSLITRMFSHHRLFGSHFPWFTSTGDICTMIAKFIRTYDCFFGSESIMTTGYGDVSLDLHSAPQKALSEESDTLLPNTASEPGLRSRGGFPPRIIPPGRVGWRPSFITFHKFDNIVWEGQEFVLIPRLWCSEAYGTGHTNVSYETLTTWLRWDDAINGFRGRIPPSSEASIGPAYYSSATSTSPGMATMRIVVTALASESFTPTVRLEKKFRSRISVKVLPIQARVTPEACVLGLPSRAEVLPDTRSDHAHLRHGRIDAEWVQQKFSSLVDFGSVKGTMESCRRGYLTPPQEQPHSAAMNTADDICQAPNDISMAMSTTGAICETLEELPRLPGIDLGLLIETRKQLLQQKRLAERSLCLSENSFNFCPSPGPSSIPSSVPDGEDDNEKGSLASLDTEKARESSFVLLHDWSFNKDSCDAEFEEERESRRVLLHDWSFEKDCLDPESEEGNGSEGNFERGCIEFDDEKEHETQGAASNWFNESCDDLHAARRGERQTPSDGALLERRNDKNRRFSELLRAIQTRDFWGSWEEDVRRGDGSESEYSLWAGSLDLA